ncbi:hypothetical protein ACI0FM_04590 [Paenochrobactrum sp. BZR 588]
MLNKSVIAVLLFAGIVLVSLSTIGKFDGHMQLVAFNHIKMLP